MSRAPTPERRAAREPRRAGREPRRVRLGVNIDHVATLRNARGGVHPELVRAAKAALAAGADGITAHLREDRRHIRDEDIAPLAALAPLNLEIAPTEEMIGIAQRVKPASCCLVPERREELTTEGGLDVAGAPNLAAKVQALSAAGIACFLFIDPEPRQIRASAAAGARGVEFHTGEFCRAWDVGAAARARETERLTAADASAHAAGLAVHAGHGLCYRTVPPLLKAMAHVTELNIGHFLVGEAVLVGLAASVQRMRALMGAPAAATG